MKKRFSTLTVVIIAFLMLATGVLASSYYHWEGSKNFDDSMNTMDKIQIGIGLLKDDLVKEENARTSKEQELAKEKEDHKKTKDELDALKDKIANAGTTKDEDGNDIPFNIDHLIAERNTLQGNINTIARKASVHVVELNEVNGTGPKYKYLVEKIGPELETLYDMGNIKAYAPLDVNPGNGPKDNQLEQAIKDMEDVKNKSKSILEEEFDEEITERIEQAHEDTDYTSGEEQTTGTDEEGN